ncbi:HD-GYP domain-containing protein [Thermoanaerobacterium thermosaccharolyticum]|jgi:putative nucleotidyltransferase with HDIG domain|uniref:Metal dependent phosphohydrolase n=1 Tax=Thermoanaerobacterium thermosaccharolyticum (strain ATCC 7956 / DSM 571 / NCIMB 9385 / NCA 3814 / NCTC 13789 / WDCM 00135 / 2032) TaxID=580327 RepID=D9TS00_THETC|nr:HD domain-containing phosphohydrolase [Thermoanaerobacterium thermosaccharolyticum]ADL69679.1 metal dependent phosphohydrolase [Thermoanaerobacterium thermosaccharolyticum DSM 571]KAA5805873.1 HD domain-containing protein [Thermoanaerobacterium thermosaccharolyticum]MBE0069651.1 HD domain-containing protein [Thermoanaerobacterium thermosaccharolyticum]MBE0229350.1 HD domain-containing protein [Thermoanaerobacterium thermosaccharolyticum]MCP2239213.1 putative nucleotidyltransferase with HDIG
MNYGEDKLISHLLLSLKNYNYETYKHSLRVAKLSFKIANMIHLSLNEQLSIYKGALLHDIGKTMIPINILSKPDKLTSTEYDLVKLHSSCGANMLEVLSPLMYLIPAVLYHHERLDGSGYPYGLKFIPLSAQIIAVCDSFDAMTNKRSYSYKKVKSFDEAIQDLKDCNNKYNQMLVSALEKVLKNNESVFLRKNNENNGIAI